MPDVGGKKFSYTPEGRKAAKAYSKRTGKAIRTNYRGGKTVAKKRKQRGRSVETMASGRPIQWQSGPVGQRRKADYMSYVAPKAARKQLKKQAAAGGPGRRATSGAGGAKAGGAVKRLQGGGISQAQQNLLRGAQEHAARSGQTPERLRQLTAQHGDLYGASQQRKARGQMAGNQPGRTSMRGIGPGMKKGGKVPSYNDLIRSKGW